MYTIRENGATKADITFYMGFCDHFKPPILIDLTKNENRRSEKTAGINF
jgi:hypothetical protein